MPVIFSEPMHILWMNPASKQRYLRPDADGFIFQIPRKQGKYFEEKKCRIIDSPSELHLYMTASCTV